MKIGILSMQRIKNYGSFLQAYSLKKNVEALGHEVEFVDYLAEKPINLVEKKPIKRDVKSYISAIRRRIYKTRAEKMALQRRAFLKRYDSEFYDMLGLTKDKNYTPVLDTLVIGSDEVFNCLQTNPEVGYSKQLFGVDNKANKVITYAASCGNTNLERLNEFGVTDEVGEWMKNIDTFSVRDNNAKEVVETLTGKETVTHLDPVLIHHWREIDAIDIELKDYIVVYAYTGRIKPNEAEIIKAFAKKHNKKIVCIGEYQSFCDMYISADPFELLAYIKKSDFVVTDTFHGTVFSIKLNRPFATILRSSEGNRYGNTEKLTSLLGKFNLMNRRVDTIENLEKIITTPVDFTEANKVIAEETERSVMYLRENL